MKIKELKKMIKAAYLSEADFTSGQDDDAAPAIANKYDFLDEADAPINIVTTMDGKTIVGTHQYGVGFKSNEAGKKMGFNDNPTSIPNGTKMSNDDSLYEAEEEKSLDDILADIIGTEKDPYMAEDLYEAEEEEEEQTDVTIDAEEKTTNSRRRNNKKKSSDDSIVVGKKIVKLSSLSDEKQDILNSLETLRAQAEEFGDGKFETQVGNTITFFNRDFVVGGDKPTKEKVDESLEILRMRKLAGLLKEGEYAKALLRETNGEPAYNNSSGLPPDIEQGQYDYEMDQYYNYRRENKTNEAESKGFNVDNYPDEDDDLIDLNKAFKATPDKLPYDKVLDIIKSYEDESILDDFKSEFPEGEDISKEDYSDFSIALIDDMSEVSYIQANWIGVFDDSVYEKAGLV